MDQDQIRAEIARLSAALEGLTTQRRDVANMQTLLPGSIRADALRQNYYNEENRRSGLLGIDQSMAGIEQQLSFYRGLLR